MSLGIESSEIDGGRLKLHNGLNNGADHDMPYKSRIAWAPQFGSRADSSLAIRCRKSNRDSSCRFSFNRDVLRGNRSDCFRIDYVAITDNRYRLRFGRVYQDLNLVR